MYEEENKTESCPEKGAGSSRKIDAHRPLSLGSFMMFLGNLFSL